MARQTALTFKTQVAAAATALNAAFVDDTTEGQMTNDFRDARNPLRDLAKLFILDRASGQFTSNDAYIDAEYAGTFSPKPTGQDTSLAKI